MNLVHPRTKRPKPTGFYDIFHRQRQFLRVHVKTSTGGCHDPDACMIKASENAGRASVNCFGAMQTQELLSSDVRQENRSPLLFCFTFSSPFFQLQCTAFACPFD